MERLTDKDGIMLACNNCGAECDGLCMKTYNALGQLAAYEDLNLTPDQIRQISDWYEELATELGRYKMAVAEAAKGNPDAKLYWTTYNEGWDAAVRYIQGRIEEGN